MLQRPELLAKVHPDLVKVIMDASTRIGIRITYGIRTLEEQKKLLAEGKSRTLKSKHLPQADGLSHACDFVPAPFNGNWKDLKPFLAVIKEIKASAAKLGVKIESGSDWKTFPDFPHVQLKQ